MHIFVDISAHGLGHLAQTAPVIAALRARRPDLRVTIASALPHARLAARIAQPFQHIDAASDFGFAMHNAIDIDFAASAQRYRQAHAQWVARVEVYAEQLHDVDLVLANAAYLPLAAAAQAGIPAVGMCSLNWADLFAHYFGTEAWAAPIHAQMLAAYNAADIFLRVTPGMPMEGFSRLQRIGPIAQLATPARDLTRQQLADTLQLDPQLSWVLVAMGGMEFRLPIERWPVLPGVRWLCPESWQVRRDDVRPFGDQLAFTELLAASDAVLTKPGYGTFVEAACNGVPVLYVPRDDWPEEAPMVEWLRTQARVVAIKRAALMAGEIQPALAALLAQAQKPRPIPSGIAEATEVLDRLLE